MQSQASWMYNGDRCCYFTQKPAVLRSKSMQLTSAPPCAVKPNPTQGGNVRSPKTSGDHLYLIQEMIPV